MSKIKRIEKIKNLRNIFSFSMADDFDKKNIIYASNGFGKTNISRMLYHIGAATSDINYLKSKECQPGESVEFSIELRDNTSITNNNYRERSPKLNILAYNADYIEKVARFKYFPENQLDAKIEFELGEDRNNLSELEDKKKSIKIDLDNIENELKLEIKNEIETVKKWDSRHNSSTEKVFIYEDLYKEKYEEYLGQKFDNSNNKNLGWHEAKKNLIETKKIDLEKTKINFDRPRISINDFDASWIKDVLTREVTFDPPPESKIQKHIESLATDWVRSGLEYYKKNHEKCPFCLTAFNENSKKIIFEYQSHINSEKTKFEDAIDRQSKIIQSMIKMLTTIHENEKDKFNSTAKLLGMKTQWHSISSTKIVGNLELIKISILNKKTNPTVISVSDAKIVDLITKDFNILESAIKHNADESEIINSKLADIGLRQTTLRKLMGKEMLVSFYEKNLEKIKNRDSFKESLASIQNEIISAKSKLPSSEVGFKVVELFNSFIKNIGIRKYEAVYDDNSKKIRLSLNSIHDISHDVNKLVSEGEKNIIALSYFLASSIEQLNSYNKFANSIFVIDDPICSVSYKYFYGICDVIRLFPDKIYSGVFNKNGGEKPQLILFTHNIQFYNMLLSNTFKYKTKKNDNENIIEPIKYFEIINHENNFEIKKINNPAKLSDFETALRRIKANSEGNLDENVGNDIRKVLETLCDFYGYKLDDSNIKEIFPDISNGVLLTFAHHSSHANLGCFEDRFNSSDYIEMSKQLISLMEINFKEKINRLPSY